MTTTDPEFEDSAFVTLTRSVTELGRMFSAAAGPALQTRFADDTLRARGIEPSDEDRADKLLTILEAENSLGELDKRVHGLIVGILADTTREEAANALTNLIAAIITTSWTTIHHLMFQMGHDAYVGLHRQFLRAIAAQPHIAALAEAHIGRGGDGEPCLCPGCYHAIVNEVELITGGAVR